MAAATIMTLVYGALALVGGIIGFVQAGSKLSLISGSITGLLLILAGLGTLQGWPGALVGAIAVTLMLLMVFVGRLTKTRKVMPAGLMVMVGVATLVIQLKALRP